MHPASPCGRSCRHRARTVRNQRFRRRSTGPARSEEHTSELQSQSNLVCRLLLEKKKSSNVPMLMIIESSETRMLLLPFAVLPLQFVVPAVFSLRTPESVLLVLLIRLKAPLLLVI